LAVGGASVERVHALKVCPVRFHPDAGFASSCAISSAAAVMK